MKRILAFTIISLFLFSIVSAEMSISEPKEIYNLGEKLYVTLDGIIGEEEGNLNIDLECGATKANLLRISARAFSQDAEQSYSLPYKYLTSDDLELNNLSSLVGKCKIISSLGNKIVKTKTFEITNKINVNSKLDKLTYNPEENVNFIFDATTANGNAFIGKYKIKNFTLIYGEMNANEITEVIALSPVQKAGTYLLTLEVYNEDAYGEKLNYGTALAHFIINQKPTAIDLSLSDLIINPIDGLTLNPELTDQSGELIEDSLTVYLESPKGEVTTYTIKSGNYLDINFSSNAPMGKWNIYSFLGEISSEKYEIEMLGFPQLEYVVEGSILNITNFGNIIYDNIINITIGEDVYQLDLLLQPEGSKQFNLQAPDGDYDIKVGDYNGDNKFSSSVALTGNSISIKDLTQGSGWVDYSWLWIFLIVIFGGLVYVITNKDKFNFEKSEKKEKPKKQKKAKKATLNIRISKFFSKKKPKKKKEKQPLESGLIDINNKRITAESALVLNGEKMTSSVLTLYIKNYDDLRENAKEQLSQILDNLSKKAVIESKGDFVFVIFSPLITKTYKNEIIATKAGLQLVKDIENYNKKFNNTIIFGAGVHMGDVITERAGRKLKYTGIGETFSLSKKMATLANSKLFVSDFVRKRLLRELKVIKEGEINKQGIYSVSEIKNKDANQAKLKDLLKRMD